MNKLTFSILSAVLLAVTSCNSYNSLQKSTDNDYKFEAAKQYYAEGYYNRATLLLHDVLAAMKGTNKGEETLFLLAMSSMNAHDYEAASSYFKKFYESYPNSIYTEKAWYYSGVTLYMDTPEPKLDQSITYDALKQFHQFLERYPMSSLRNDAQMKIFELQDKLVEKEYLSAKLYFDLGTYFMNCPNGGSNYQACVITAENAIRDYPYSSKREEFAFLILRAKYELARNSIESRKVERYNSAIDEYYGFTNEYPESQHMKAATEMFNKAQAAVKKQGGVISGTEDEYGDTTTKSTNAK